MFDSISPTAVIGDEHVVLGSYTAHTQPCVHPDKTNVGKLKN